MTSEEISRLRTKIAGMTGTALPEVSVSQGEGLSVDWDAGRAALIAADGTSAVCRGLFRLARAAKEGAASLHIRESRHFRDCGVMLDMSRGCVWTVASVRRYIDTIAALGLNLLMLYTEDTYEIPEYPYFGYLRGRYTAAELKEIDAYAAFMGVRVIPCIQTLAHLAQFLQWSPSAGMADQPDVLMVGEEQVYDLIRAEIRTMRECFRDNVIHVGMDEAHGIGLGRWAQKNGLPEDRFALLNSHLAKVADICREYGFRPMMWSDMYFRLGSAKNDYYDPDAVIPPSVAEGIPDVELCYWDYYHNDRDFYARMLRKHRMLNRPVAFAGGIWTWSGFLPQVRLTEETLLPALRACAEDRTQTVFATMWGDNGAETDYFLADGLLPMLSEVCWQGPEAPRGEMTLSAECLTGLPWSAVEAMGEFYADSGFRYSGKAMIWCDVLFPMLEEIYEKPAEIADRAVHALSVLGPLPGTPELDYARALFEILAVKGRLLSELRAGYLAKDMAYLAETADRTLPLLIGKYDALLDRHRALWQAHAKRPGWEVLALRYGAVKERLRDVSLELKQYVNGEIPSVEALEAEPLSAGRSPFSQTFRNMVTPQYLG